MTAEEFEKKGLEILSDPKRFDMEIMYLIQELLKNPKLSEKTKLDLISKMTQVKTALWGSKAINLNLNADKPESAMSMHEVYEEIKQKRQSE